MTFEDLMTGLAEMFGVDGGLAPDSNGIVSVETDGMTLSFLEQHDYPVPGRTSLILWGRFDGPGPEDAAALDAEMLRANDRQDDPGGPTLSLLGEAVCLQRTLPLELMDVETLVTEADDFASELFAWRDRVRDYRPDDGTAGGGQTDATGFMSV